MDAAGPALEGRVRSACRATRKGLVLRLKGGDTGREMERGI